MFSTKESLKFGWQKVKENMQFSLFSTIILLALGCLTNLHVAMLGVLAIVVFIIVRIGYFKVFLRLYDGESPKLENLFSEYSLFWKFLGVSILTGLVTGIGLILLVIPGIIWAVRFSLASVILVDTKARPVAAMKESWALTRGKFWKLLGFWIVVCLVNLVGFLVVGVGLLFTIPASTLASIQVYRKLSQEKQSLAVVH